MAAIESFGTTMEDGLIFANLVDFDMLYGHRRDAGWLRGRAGRVRCMARRVSAGDRGRGHLIITADHGNDPTWRGSDHTREEVPLLVKFDGARSARSAHGETFADVAASLASFFQLKEKWPAGHAFFKFDRKHAGRLQHHK